ncbi:MAG TPA: hypothetical protein PLN61_09180 [bacterium]|nr:hypothetical protein [bacterium]HQI48828.1 hypothetical protein [bacterium]HQJ64337.1 hypothetical protein [bacterium]HQJ65449.1 hypothetical protein [bacterium]
MKSLIWKFALVGAALVLVLALLTGCGEKQAAPTAAEPVAAAGEWTLDNPAIQAVAAVQERHTASLMKNSEVVGTYVTVTEAGQPVIVVMTKSPVLQKGPGGLPAELESVPLLVQVTGEIKAMKSSSSTSHTAKQTPPIQLGTSGGWSYDLANGYCCGGTLGSLIKIGSAQYILSNYHVLEADIVSGGNSRVATSGDPVIQPGLIDVNCSAAGAQNVATLVVKNSLPSNNVDCAVAQVISGMVRTDGSILEIGTLSATTVAASVGQAVKKSGRTTGLTRSSVSGLNGTVSVSYENECAGGTAFTKTFTGQIIIANKQSKFLNSGDSGSLMVQDVTTNPKAIGLLFAGSNTTAVANPINEVLSFLGATMVGN